MRSILKTASSESSAAESEDEDDDEEDEEEDAMSDDKMDEDADDDFGLNSLLEADPSKEGGAPYKVKIYKSLC